MFLVSRTSREDAVNQQQPPSAKAENEQNLPARHDTAPTRRSNPSTTETPTPRRRPRPV